MTEPTEPHEMTAKERSWAKIRRNERMIQRLEAMSKGEKVRTYRDLMEIADVLDLRADPPSPEQVQQIRTMLLETQDAIAKLLEIFDRFTPPQ
ncbi:MAG TPA: hypothetical protein V6D14_01345 [Coleofasciculaceae cyanobacterium]|jgi:hypothetical protein